MRTALLLLTCMSILVGCGSDKTPTPRVGATPPTPVAGDDKPCANASGNRKQAFFGDLHTHTAFSLDAYFFNATNDPRAAHDFAQGQPGHLPALGSDDPYTPARTVQIGRPLDFNAVTDHAEFLGGFTNTCARNETLQKQCDERIGKGIREDVVNIAAGNTSLQQQLLQSLIAFAPTSTTTWQNTKQINDDVYKPCQFTTLHGYEFTSNEDSQMFHRNVIFKGDTARVPAIVFSAVRPDTALNPQNGNDDWDLFDHLNVVCKSIPGCDVLTIPHNGNLSDGRMWLPMEANGIPLGRKVESTDVYLPMTAADANLRRSLDAAVEITQHKGQSECAVGLEGPYLQGEESACTFETFKTVCHGRPDDPATCATFCKGDPLTDPNFCQHRSLGDNVVDTCVNPGPDGRSRPSRDPLAKGTGNCSSALDYYRNAMAEGLAIRKTLGINPYKANIVAASDTHNGLSGNVGERGFVGHGGVLDDEPKELLGFWNCTGGGDPADPSQCVGRKFQDFARTLNPGGLTGVWATQNKRNEIWDAIRRGESWGTSGPRIKIRTIGGWKLPANTCDRLAAGENPVDLGEVKGALMGGDLPLPAKGAPQIAVWAQQDPENYPLQRIDIVKGYVDASGKPRVKVFENVARTRAPVNRPSMTDCRVEVSTHPEQLCTVWTDPEFSPTQDAYYYAKALEVPSCRWSAFVCNVEKKVDCSLLSPANGLFPASSGFSGYEGCCATTGSPGSFRGRNTFNTIEERAWASPIWYEQPLK